LIFAILAALLQSALGQPSHGPQTGTSQLHGQISEPDGRPIPGARVRIQCNFARGDTAVTDTAIDGQYEINNLPAGICSVIATKVGYVAVSGPNGPLGVATAQVPLSEGAATERDLEMARGADVSGRVVNEQGEPVARVAVMLMRRDIRNGQAVFGTVGTQSVGRTDANGEFRIAGMEAGTYYLCAAIPNIVRGQTPAGELNGCYRSHDMRQAEPLPLTLGQSRSGLEFTIAPGPRLETVMMMPFGHQTSPVQPPVSRDR
jgi:hypothetical protein